MRRVMLSTLAAGAAAFVMPARPEGDIVGGTGSLTYKYDPTKLQLPAGVEVKNAHGLTLDPQGNVYFTYESPSVTNDTRALIRFDPNGENAVLLGNSTLAEGVPHGLKYFDGHLYHANNAALLTKTDLEGNIIWRVDMTKAFEGGANWPFKPTDAIVSSAAPDTLFIADGYGSSFVQEFETASGAYTGVKFGGRGDSTAPQQFSTDHGIVYDEKRGHFIVADRGNNRLQYVTLNGTHLGGVNMSKGAPFAAAGTQPCNVNFDHKYTQAVVPGLDGPVGVFDASIENLLSVIPVGTLLAKQCPHPHDAVILDNGDIIVCCWAPGFISYWSRQ